MGSCSWFSTISERPATLSSQPLSPVAGSVGVVDLLTEDGLFTEEVVGALEAVFVVVRVAATGFVVERVS